MADEIAFLPAIQLLRSYRSKQLSPVEVIEGTLRRLEQYESALNAFVLYDPQIAMAMARASETRWQKGKPQGVLDGIPVAIKDTLLTRGWPRLLRSRTIDRNQAWDEDAPAPARLRGEGAVFFGKTTTPEFGWKGVTDSPLTGITRNPWDKTKTPGGSSGGAVVAVACGIGPIALGGDGGGSRRMHCGFTGGYGIEPTAGLVPNVPSPSVGTMTTPGPIARNVGDGALMLHVLAGADWRDPTALPPQDIHFP